MRQGMPVPLHSPDTTPVDLRHPTPDLQSLQGAYVGNIERLEEHAERMSEHGSDLGEEIRKLQIEQKLSDSRRSSLLSAAGAPPADEPLRHISTRSRNASTSSYTNSIVDVNGAARWGGYSPGGYITSPVGSLRSASFSQPAPSLQRQRSGSRASRLGQVMQSEEEDNYMTHASSPHAARDGSPSLVKQRSVSSFTRKYDQIAQEIQEEMHNSQLDETNYAGQPSHHEQHAHSSHPDHHDLPDRPPTAASTDTTHQARTLWHDFDGVHCPDTVPEEDPTPSHGSGSRQSSMLKSAPDMLPQGAPPPSDGMVFYPAPVPKMLNMPKRLSQVPAAATQARRRTQLLESMQAENRKSTAWMHEGGSPADRSSRMMDARKSRQSLANLPPQLRASAYFDQVAPAQEFEVKGDSAEDTLNNILEASAHAPVSAFTDHPFAGHVGDEVYGRDHARRASKANELDLAETRKSRSSLNLLDTRLNSNGDPLNKLKKRNSSADLNLLTVRASESRMSLGDELDEPDKDARGPDNANNTTPTRDSFDAERRSNADDEEEAIEGEEEQEQHFGPPTTLLAELQMRKQQQKNRNLTAATAFPNGMHSTLLELDAVAEVERKKRVRTKVNLAWEAQPLPGAEDESSDEDVPLGVLYPGREGLLNKKRGGTAPQQGQDWDRPLGLIAQRELEDNEPLSRRRNRLLGGEPHRPRDMSPGKRQTHHPDPSTSQPHLGDPAPHSEPEEEEGETLAQRVRRLKNQQTLDNAIGDVRKSTVSGDFAAEMMSQFGMPEEEDKPKPTTLGQPEEETLGQRRARLQAEALARGEANPLGNRPPLRASMSMADVLGAHPIDHTNQARKVSDEMLMSALPPGSLLRQNAEKQERRKLDKHDQSKRISSFGSLDQPLLGKDMDKIAADQPIAGKIQAYKDKMSGRTTPHGMPQSNPMSHSNPSMVFNEQTTGRMTPAMSAMNLPAQRNSVYPQANMPMASPAMGMGGMGMAPNNFGYPAGNMNAVPPQMMAMNMGMMGMPMGGMQGMTYPYPQMGGMGSMQGMRQSSMVNLPMQMNPMQMQQNPNMMMMMEPPMDPRQRDMIDRWRQSVMH
ncbi:hypothetical protein BS50DRAFT_597216 [Corynespora cassiicola Philippines]|uniref:Uncharacterized protein n=1 Tax=Corynespora cassiicola Philippines TaxID=1448308 RepID=A0A2T2P7W7_CORCC|nr:hypothetical protein BS50DRAFT_597216 [Corynespora cassiicola Philippines]